MKLCISYLLSCKELGAYITRLTYFIPGDIVFIVGDSLLIYEATVTTLSPGKWDDLKYCTVSN